MINLLRIKMKHLCHYICLISYTNTLQLYEYLVSSLRYYYLLFLFFFSNKIYTAVSFKIVLKSSEIKTPISPEIIRKPMIFWWFQGESKLINSVKLYIIEAKFGADLLDMPIWHKNMSRYKATRTLNSSN